MGRKIFIAITLCVLISGCASKPATKDKNIFTVSILPLKYVIYNIVGDDIKISTLLPPGASPETYEITPSQMVDIANSDKIFVTGLIDFEKQLSNRITRQGDENKVVNLSEGINLIEGSCAHSGHSHAHGTDPHIWSSPRNLKIMARTAYNSIALLYPDSIKYKINFDRFITRLDSLDVAVNKLISDSNINSFVIYHPALTYFARDYGIKQMALEDEGKEPSADKLKTIISTATADGVTKILYQKEFKPATVEAMAKEMGVRCMEIDPLSEDVVDNLLYMATAITSK